jgi:hypothetical protein
LSCKPLQRVPLAGRSTIRNEGLVSLTQQAQIIAYLDDYQLLLVATLAVLPLLFVFRRPASPGAGDPVVMD